MSQQLSPRALNPWRSLRRRLGAVLGRRPRTRGRLRLEQLEDRTVPTLAVTEVSVINSLGSSNVGSKANLNGTLIFAAADGVHGTELWKSDGTAAGTVLIKDIFPGFSGGTPNSAFPSQLTTVGNLVFFTANDGTDGNE